MPAIASSVTLDTLPDSRAGHLRFSPRCVLARRAGKAATSVPMQRNARSAMLGHSFTSMNVSARAKMDSLAAPESVWHASRVAARAAMQFHAQSANPI